MRCSGVASWIFSSASGASNGSGSIGMSGTAAVEAVRDAGWLAPGGLLAVETEAGEAVEAGAWTIAAERRVGRARLTLIGA